MAQASRSKIISEEAWPGHLFISLNCKPGSMALCSVVLACSQARLLETQPHALNFNFMKLYGSFSLRYLQKFKETNVVDVVHQLEHIGFIFQFPREFFNSNGLPKAKVFHCLAFSFGCRSFILDIWPSILS